MIVIPLLLYLALIRNCIIDIPFLYTKENMHGQKINPFFDVYCSYALAACRVNEPCSKAREGAENA